MLLHIANVTFVLTLFFDNSAGPPVITSCRAIRTEGDTCLVPLETDLDEASVDCRANGAAEIKYEWIKQGLVLYSFGLIRNQRILTAVRERVGTGQF